MGCALNQTSYIIISHIIIIALKIIVYSKCENVRKDSIFLLQLQPLLADQWHCNKMVFQFCHVQFFNRISR